MQTQKPRTSAEILSLLKKMDYRMTGPRKIIFEQFIKQPSHISSEEFYLRLKEKYPHLGRATVYRTLKLLTGAGLTESICLEDGITRFELKHNRPHHDHLRCVKCGKIEEFVNPVIEQPNKASLSKISLLTGLTYLKSV